MNLFAVFICTLVIIEGWAARNLGLCPTIVVPNGRIRYRQRGKIARFLCNTGFMLAGDRYSVCVGGKWDNVVSKCVRATCQDAKTPVNGLIYPSFKGAVLNFYCKSGFELRGANITYCDGVQWDNPLPACLATNLTTPLSCDFEQEDLCGWNHDLNHNFDWKRQNYATPSGSIGTGPSHDHTTGKDGYYMYIESSARNINDTARLISPVYDKSNETVCFEFFYHMYGSTTGSLRVYLKKVDETWKLTPQHALFIKSGNQGNRWYRGFIVLGVVETEFQIVIEGVRGVSYVSDIAIDDVKLIRNCVPEDELQEVETTTYDLMSSETPISVESCENRCDSNDTRTLDSLITCDCDEGCYERNRCCPDYFDFCLTGTSIDDYYTTESSTSITSTSTSTTESETTATTRTTTTATKSKINYIKPKETDVVEVPTTIRPAEVETPGAPIKDTELINDYASDKTFDHHKIEVVSNMQESNTKTIIFAVGVVFGVLFAMVGMAFVARRYQLFHCNRLHQSSSGDSQSDVRFLTSDEVLDFSLAADYDTL